MKVALILRGVFFLLVQNSFAINISLISSNLCSWGENTSQRISKIGDKIQNEFLSQTYAQSPRIVLLQEVIQKNGISTADDLAKKLNMKYLYKKAHQNEGIGILFNQELFISNENSLDIKSKAHEGDYSRAAQAIQFYLPDETGKSKTLRIINTHLAHEPTYENTRKKQISEIINWLHKLEEESQSDIIILGGDFNTGLTENYYADEFDVLFNSKFFFELPLLASQQATWFDEVNSKAEKVDYFFNSGLNSKNILSKEHVLDLHSEKLSDHDALALSISPIKESY